MQPEELAAEWHAFSQQERPDLWSQLDEAPYEDPEAAWAGILAALELEFTGLQEAILAAGPLENLLSLHGEQFIERVEAEAARNPRFNHLLGGVWQCSMSEGVWGKVQAARREVW